jgi:hypothetical protein
MIPLHARGHKWGNGVEKGRKEKEKPKAETCWGIELEKRTTKQQSAQGQRSQLHNRVPMRQEHEGPVASSDAGDTEHEKRN